LDSKNAGAFNNRGLAYQRMKMDLKAQADFRKANELNPTTTLIYRKACATTHNMVEFS